MQIKQTSKGWSVQLRIGQGRRPSFQLPPMDEPAARARALRMGTVARLLVESGRVIEAHEALVELAQCASDDDFEALVLGLEQLSREPLPVKPAGLAGMTFSEFGDEWTSGRLAEKFKNRGKLHQKKSAKTDEGFLLRLCAIAHPSYGRLGDVPMATFSLADFELALDGLPETVKSNSTRRQYAQVMGRLLNLAVKPARIRAESPIEKGELPDVAERLEFQCLYPSEDAQLMACVDLDIEERFAFGLGVRLGIRLANLFGLRRRDVDIDNSQLWVPDSKTGRPVAFDLDEGCARALTWWFARPEWRGKPREATVLKQWHLTGMSKRLRKALQFAGIDREQLYEKTAHQHPVRFHDLRASFITMALANGKSEAWIRERTGHTTSQMIYLYNRPRFSKLALRDWLPLDEALGLTAAVDAAREEPEQAHQDGDAQSAPEHGSLPPALVVELEPSAEVDHLGDALGSEMVASTLAAALLPSEGSDQVIPALGTSEMDKLDQGRVGEGTAWNVGHGVGPFGGEVSASSAGLVGGLVVATGVATEFSADEGLTEGSSMFSVTSESTPGGIRTPDQLIRNPHSRSAGAHESEAPPSLDTRERTRAHGAPLGLPLSSLGEDYLAELTEVAVAAKRWHLVAALAADLDTIAQARAAQSNVTHLGVERRKRGAS